MNQSELKTLEKEIAKIHEIAVGFGLDFFPMRFELVPSEIMYTFGAYGMPTRFSHWSFGKAFHRMKTQYDYNLSRIYELVINSDPCYAFLLEGNTLIQNKLVVAHVYAHCDFFKNNAYFQPTNRKMIETMSANGRRIREYEFKYGQAVVESFLDAVLALEEHIDPRQIRIKEPVEREKEPEQGAYDDLWNIGVQPSQPKPKPKRKKIPKSPEKDMLLFLANHGHFLDDWQRDVIYMVREEMLYFWPQIETKIMNEGWASLWHARIIQELDLTEDEVIDFAKLNASVIQPSPVSLNPYYIGYKMFGDIEKRWQGSATENSPGECGGDGRNKIFEVREMENDVSFLRNYLTKELVEKLDLYMYRKVGNDWVIVEKNWEKVRDGLVSRMTNGGFPYLVVEDGDYQLNGELYLKHCYDGQELDIPYMEKTLPHVFTLWGRTVNLETIMEGKPVLFTHDGKKNQRKTL
ncbi:MAG: SpoVR family protein [Bacillota bacterium]